MGVIAVFRYDLFVFHPVTACGTDTGYKNGNEY